MNAEQTVVVRGLVYAGTCGSAIVVETAANDAIVRILITHHAVTDVGFRQALAADADEAFAAGRPVDFVRGRPATFGGAHGVLTDARGFRTAGAEGLADAIPWAAEKAVAST